MHLSTLLDSHWSTFTQCVVIWNNLQSIVSTSIPNFHIHQCSLFNKKRGKLCSYPSSKSGFARTWLTIETPSQTMSQTLHAVHGVTKNLQSYLHRALWRDTTSRLDTLLTYNDSFVLILCDVQTS